MKAKKSLAINIWPKRCTVYFLRDAAWCFASSILWSGREFSSEETDLAKSYIFNIFKNAPHRKKALVAFCERIILTEKYQTAQGTHLALSPAAWFDETNQQGFAETKNWLACVDKQRQESPDHLRHIKVIASHYLLYALRPSVNIYMRCCKKLGELNAFGLLKHFYSAINGLTI